MLAQDASEIDRLAAALAEDGVVVESAVGSGEPTQSHDRIAALVREVPFPVYVALVQTPRGASRTGEGGSEALTALLQQRLGKGVYVVTVEDDVVDGNVRAYGLGVDNDSFVATLRSNLEVVKEAGELLDPDGYFSLPPVLKAELVVHEVEEAAAAGRAQGTFMYESTVDSTTAHALAERGAELNRSTDWTPPEQDWAARDKGWDEGTDEGWSDVRRADPAYAVAIGTAVGGILALVVAQSALGWPRRRRSTAVSGQQTVLPPGARAGVRRRPSGSALGATERPGPIPQRDIAQRNIADRSLSERKTTSPASTAREQELVLAHEVEAAHRALSTLQARVDGFDPDEARGTVPSEQFETGLLAVDVGRGLLDMAERARDPFLAVAAAGVARAGKRQVAMAAGKASQAYRPCFFDPRHGHTARSHIWRLGDGEVVAPTCHPCQIRLERGDEPDSLLRARAGEDRPTGGDQGRPRASRGRSQSELRPYWQFDDLWARTGLGALDSNFVRTVAAASMQERRGS